MNMDFKAGDKVKFLNEKGGGVVTRIIDPRMVSVAIEDGFEMPVLVSELILIDPQDAGGRFFAGGNQRKVEAAPLAADLTGEALPRPDGESSLSPETIRTRKSEEIHLAFVPHDQKLLMAGLIDIFLVNNTSYDILYNIFHKTATGHYEGVDYGSVFADTTQLIETINRENIPLWSDGYLQFLFHREHNLHVLPPFNSEFKIDGKKFYKEGNYRPSPLIQGKGIVMKVLSLTEYFRGFDQPGVPEENKPAQAPADPPLIFKYQTDQREAEVDLHAHELIEDPSYLEKSEILEYQKKFFIRCLESAIANNFLKVTFIHGVGNGVLRTVLLEQMKSYPSIEVFDAPMAKYGVGAFEIRIPHNMS
jgi:hypothetical protein